MDGGAFNGAVGGAAFSGGVDWYFAGTGGGAFFGSGPPGAAAEASAATAVPGGGGGVSGTLDGGGTLGGAAFNGGVVDWYFSGTLDGGGDGGAFGRNSLPSAPTGHFGTPEMSAGGAFTGGGTWTAVLSTARWAALLSAVASIGTAPRLLR